MSIIIFLIILAVLILVHEFGHFIVAKKSGIRVDEFGLGFPPKIYSKKFGGTLYTLNAIPFGGFVKIFGEDSHVGDVSDLDKSTSFVYKPKWIQALVLVAGVAFNIIFAWILISSGFIMGVSASQDYSHYGKISNTHVVITDILPDSPAQKAGIKIGDTIVSVSSSGKKIDSENISLDLVKNLISNSSGDISVSIKRGSDSIRDIKLDTSSQIIPGKKAIGIAMDEIGTLKLPVHLAFLEGARATYLLTKNTAVGLLSFFGGVFSFKSDLSQVSGPVGIAGVVGEAAHLGFSYLVSLTALISINLAIINLLPFPALDGGRLLFVAIEVMRRKPISPKFVNALNFFGFALLLCLMVVVTIHDILKFF